MLRILALIVAVSLTVGKSVAFSAPAGDPAAGVKVFGLCTACHSLQPNVNMTGPSLAGVWGRTAGTLQSFPRYSNALRKSGIVWNEKTLDRWLADPAGFIPHNRMTIRGVTDPEARADVIALLHLAGPDGPTGAAAAVPAFQEPDLKTQKPAHQVCAITLCGDTYHVTTADGHTAEFWEPNLRFKTDSSVHGPEPDVPAIMSTGMFGDRAAVIFARPEEIGSFIKRAC